MAEIGTQLDTDGTLVVTLRISPAEYGSAGLSPSPESAVTPSPAPPETGDGNSRRAAKPRRSSPRKRPAAKRQSSSRK